MERAAPYVLQIPGVSPKPLAKKYADLLDLRIEDLYKAGLPSIAAQNQIPGPMQPGGAGQGAQSDPNAQGGKGAQNQEKPSAQQPGPQPAYPAGGAPNGPNMMQ